MPEIGEIKRAWQAGINKKAKSHRMIWTVCSDCGVGRWVNYHPERPNACRCKPCSLKARCVEKQILWSGDGTPKIGEITLSNNVGYKTGKYARSIWVRCPGCGAERWVCYGGRTKESYPCKKCVGKTHRGERSYQWKGRIANGSGYVDVWLSSDDFFYPMTKSKSVSNSGGYVLEHRLLMAKHLGRCLHNWEIVHHINHDRKDNRIENLMLCGDDKHQQITIMETKIKRLEKRVEALELSNRDLKRELSAKMRLLRIKQGFTEK